MQVFIGISFLPYIIVLANGLGAYYLDGEVFLKTLCKHSFLFNDVFKLHNISAEHQSTGEHVRPLRQVLATSATEASLKLLCRRIGDPTSAVCYGASCTNAHSADASQLDVHESVVARPQNFPTAGGLIVAFTVCTLCASNTILVNLISIRMGTTSLILEPLGWERG